MTPNEAYAALADLETIRTQPQSDYAYSKEFILKHETVIRDAFERMMREGGLLRCTTCGCVVDASYIAAKPTLEPL
jgi:hypothetical protein